MCALDPRDTVNHPGTDPNKGMNTRSYLLWVVGALVVLLIVLFFVATKPGPKDLAPKPDRRPNSSISAPQDGSPTV
jgi:hypothetical protein